MILSITGTIYESIRDLEKRKKKSDSIDKLRLIDKKSKTYSGEIGNETKL